MTSKFCDTDFRNLAFKAMGTNCGVIYRTEGAERDSLIGEEILKFVRYFEGRYSRYDSESLISLINTNAGVRPTPIKEEDYRLFEICAGLNFLTEGMFDPTTLPLSNLWDFKRKIPEIPTDSKVQSALKKVGWSKVLWDEKSVFLTEKGMGLDFGGMGKEYSVDCLHQMLCGFGVEDFLINLGGDIRCNGSSPQGGAWVVGIEDPTKPGETKLALSITNGAVATSGTYMRYFDFDGKRYSHLIDHRKGYPVPYNTYSSSVIAGSCLEAGVLATASLLKGDREGVNLIDSHFNAEGCVRTAKGLYWTKNLGKYLIPNVYQS